MRNITIDGRIGKDAEILVTPKGNECVRFSVANTLFSGGTEQTTWFDIVCYDSYIINKVKEGTAKGNNPYFKGRYVIITGTWRTDMNEGKNGKIYINHMIYATNIETPHFGNTTTNNTSTTPVVATAPVQPEVVTYYTEPQPAYAGGMEMIDEQDLPF